MGIYLLSICPDTNPSQIQWRDMLQNNPRNNWISVLNVCESAHSKSYECAQPFAAC